MKHILAITVAAAMLASNAGAVPIHYIYTGDFYTESTAPETPDFRLTDRITGRLTIDSSLWGTEVIELGDLLEADYGFDFNGPLRFTFSPAGEVLTWFVALQRVGLDAFSIGNEDGSGFDGIISHAVPGAHASINYPAGSPSRWSFGPLSVPDTGTTLLLLSLAFAPMLLWRRLA